MLKITEKNYKWWVTLAMGLVIFILCVDWTIVTLAIPRIADYMHSSLSQMQWIINAYVLTSSMFMILGGRLADLYGKRKILLLGLVIFTASIGVAGMVSNEWVLIGCRAIQGVGAALGLPLGVIFMFEAFPESQHGFAVGMVGGIAGFSLAIGPTLGGFILNWLSWRWVFYVNVPFGVLGFLLAIWVLKKEEVATNVEKIDYFSAFVLSLGLLGIIIALNESQNWGLSPLFWFCLIGGFVLIFLLPLVGRLSKGTLIDPKVLKNRLYLLINFIRLCIQYMFGALGFIVVLYLQNILGYTPLKTGIIMLFMTLIFGITSPFSGKMVDAFGAYRLIVLGIIAAAISVFLFSRVDVNPLLFALALPLFLAGVSISFILPACTKTALSTVPSEDRGVATSIYYTIAFISGGIGIAISGTMMARLSYSRLKTQLLKHGVEVAKAKVALLSKMATGAHPVKEISQHFSQSLTTKLIPITQHAFLYAFSWVMWVCFILMIISLILAAILRKWFDDVDKSSDVRIVD